jgi:ABC-2 type transport system ATP-binding protein
MSQNDPANRLTIVKRGRSKSEEKGSAANGEERLPRKRRGGLSMDIAISVQHVFKKFGEETVLQEVSHDFEEGKIHGIVGNNGSGKTVLMKCICGFLLPTKGKILVRYKQVGKDLDFPEDMGIIIETPGFLPNLSGAKNLEILASLKRKIGSDTIQAAIRRVGLDPAMKKPVGKYSLGMRQRLGIAQAIMENPSILILDEPLNGLDKTGVKEMRALIKELRGAGKTIILASHNPMDIDELCDTVCEMDAGFLTVVR